jgi:hypothetical protein
VRWGAVTLGLLAACVSLSAWIYLRDHGSDWRPPERQVAIADAHLLLSGLAGAHCAQGCGARLLGRSGPNLWLARLTVRDMRYCFEIDLDRFASSGRHGFAGVQPGGCGRT